jgi:hypothetical protein
VLPVRKLVGPVLEDMAGVMVALLLATCWMFNTGKGPAEQKLVSAFRNNFSHMWLGG